MNEKLKKQTDMLINLHSIYLEVEMIGEALNQIKKEVKELKSSIILTFNKHEKEK